ncbi:MAG: hypothetical protein WBJ84_04885 [Bacteroidales bacterium]
MYKFTDFQECKVDAKGRLLFPAVYRKTMGEALAEGFVLKRSINTKSLQLYTKASWEKTKRLIEKLNKFKQQNQIAIRHLMDGVMENVQLDSAGRILLPKELVNYAEIKNDVTLSPAFDYLEIWDSDNYKLIMTETMEDIGEIIDKVLGDIEED